MAGWSRLSHSSRSIVDVEVEYVNECEERVKRLFDEALLVFLEEEGSHRPIPPVLGDGVKVDLFKLFLLVWQGQGFESVSRLGLWESVTEKLGLDYSLSPSLRLVYLKYLNRMEKWAMKESRNVNWDNKDSKFRLLHELGNGFKGLLEIGKCQKRNRAMALSCNRNHIKESGSSEVDRSGKRIRECSQENDERQDMSCVIVISDDDDDDVVSVEEESFDLSYKRQGDLPEMLKWLTSVARCPNDPSIGVIPPSSKWNKFTGNECWIQVTRARNALMVQRDDAEFRCQHTHVPGHQLLNHPSMYEDETESLASYNGSSVSGTKSRSTNCKQPTRTRGRADLVPGTYGGAITEIPRRQVPVGRRYQAQVDEWTGPSLESDIKWLGTRLWPLENEEALNPGDDMIGKGRPDSCSCDVVLPGSVECTRFHIAEKRMVLRRELGNVFLHWRFHLMGEEVSLRWTEREERRFKSMIISDPQRFWENAKRWFRTKTREELVSYFFNVFLIYRRRYQNRVTPRQIDSDDEENFGSVGSSFGRDAVSSIGSDIMICSQNNQCYDLD